MRFIIIIGLLAALIWFGYNLTEATPVNQATAVVKPVVNPQPEQMYVEITTTETIEEEVME